MFYKSTYCFIPDQTDRCCYSANSANSTIFIIGPNKKSSDFIGILFLKFFVSSLSPNILMAFTKKYVWFLFFILILCHTKMELTSHSWLLTSDASSHFWLLHMIFIFSQGCPWRPKYKIRVKFALDDHSHQLSVASFCRRPQTLKTTPHPHPPKAKPTATKC